jgi:CRISPR/Cas system-associated protein Cas5 (RAMP superfamily)
MKYIITVPYYPGSPKLIEYICDFSEIKGNFKELKATLVIETKSDLLALRIHNMNYKPLKKYSQHSEIRQLIDSIDINTLAD